LYPVLVIAMEGDMKNLSKWLSYILRHEPHSIGLVLDGSGWASIADLIAKSAEAGKVFTHEEVLETVRTSDKQRFTLSPDGLRMRAAQGHSIDVDLKLEPKMPSEILFHGTATRFLPSIRAEGLLPMGRTHVHLSKDKETAHKVGARHGTPVILQVDTRGMVKSGAEFFLADNGVWLVAKVPPENLTELELPSANKAGHLFTGDPRSKR
jgi:putative RNA 2'-phosphotransferase